MNYKRILLSEKANILCDLNYITFWKRQNYKHGKLTGGAQGDSVCWGVGSSR